MNYITMIPYAIIVMLLLIVAFFYVDLSHTEAARKVAEDSLKTAVDANKAQDKTITELRQLRALDDKTINDLNSKVTKYNTNASKLEDKINTLDKGDKDVHSYLIRVVPHQLGGLLNTKHRD